MATLHVLHDSPSDRDRIRRTTHLRAAGGSGCTLRFASSWEEIRGPGSLGKIDIIIIDAYWSGQLDIPELKAAIRTRPDAPIVVYSDFSSRPAADVLRLRDLGLELILSMGVDDHPSQIADALDAAAHAPDKAWLLQDPSEVLGPAALAIVQAAAALVDAGPNSADELCRRLGLTRRSLERRCSSLGLPSPKRILELCRAHRAVVLLRDRDRTVASVASSLGFSDESTMRRSIRRQVGRRPTEIREVETALAVQRQILREFKGSDGLEPRGRVRALATTAPARAASPRTA